jgi:hypothetical protein
MEIKRKCKKVFKIKVDMGFATGISVRKSPTAGRGWKPWDKT